MSNFKKIKEFGFGSVGMYYLYSALGKVFKKCNQTRHKYIIKYLEKHYLSELDNVNLLPESDNKYIWICWWQGEESAPEIVKKCISSIRANAGDSKVCVIDSTNFKTYVNIPDYILQKLDSKQITITHFSDILRMTLLSQYGGIWIDATMYVTDSLETYLKYPFYSVKRDSYSKFVSQNKWTAYFLVANGDGRLLPTLAKMYYMPIGKITLSLYIIFW